MDEFPVPEDLSLQSSSYVPVAHTCRQMSVSEQGVEGSRSSCRSTIQGWRTTRAYWRAVVRTYHATASTSYVRHSTQSPQVGKEEEAQPTPHTTTQTTTHHHHPKHGHQARARSKKNTEQRRKGTTATKHGNNTHHNKGKKNLGRTRIELATF